MEFNVTKVTMVINNIGLENSLCFEFDGGYFKVSRPNENKTLQFETKGNTFEIPINKLSTKKNKRWIKFATDNGKISAYFFIKNSERKFARNVIYKITGIEYYNEPIIFTWEFEKEDNKKIDYLGSAVKYRR